MSPYDVPAWADFGLGATVVAAVVLAGGAGVLAPLLGGPRRGRAGLTLAVPLCLALVALCLLVPGQSRTAVGIEVIAGGAVLGLAAVIWAGTTARAPGEPTWSRPVVLATVLLPAALLLVGGTSLAVASSGGLYWVFAATAVGLAATVVGAGLLVAESGA